MSSDQNTAPNDPFDRRRNVVTWRILLGFVVADALLWLALPLWW
jgi:hypothetical protein